MRVRVDLIDTDLYRDSLRPPASCATASTPARSTLMRRQEILVESIDDDAALEIVQVVAIDDCARRAVEGPPNDGLGARLVVDAPNQQHASAPRAAMVVVVADARGRPFPPSVTRARSPTALSVAAVAVDDGSSVDLAELCSGFDAVVAARVGTAEDPTTALASAVVAITASATANRISIPVDEMYPFFLRGGVMTYGVASDADAVTATTKALAAALGGGTRASKRILLHVDSTDGEYMTDLACAAQTVQRAARLDNLEIAASVRGLAVKRVSVLAGA